MKKMISKSESQRGRKAIHAVDFANSGGTYSSAGEFFRKKNGTNTNSENEKEDDAAIIESKVEPLTPQEAIEKQYKQSLIKKESQKAAFYSVMKIVVPIFSTIVVAIIISFATIWLYKIDKLSEPIGGIKADIQNIKDRNREIKSEIFIIEERLFQMKRETSPNKK